uniref:GATA zinc finger domain-containing protein 7-like isoform X1 n=2 Tax=Dermatophagoides pteronyssinus TaxID=6956 RepID=A0A6P6XVC2_DERPT|nr:GATA zinc finger domain-containing protein 7-like isoform X1 [Dermatophagoides pteronyssinus]
MFVSMPGIQDFQDGHPQPSSGVEICYNDKGDMVKHGEQYVPLGIDTCTQCTCMHGKAEMCISVLCSPPENCRRYHELTNKCCEFLCIDGGNGNEIINSNNGNSDMAIRMINTGTGHHYHSNNFNGGLQNGLRFLGNNNNKTAILTKGETKTFHSIPTSNLGLRLITSTVTSFLILALLLFMIHRLRQRRLLMMIRRLQNRRLNHMNASNSGHHLPPPPPHCNDPSGYGVDQLVTTPMRLFGLGGHSSINGPFGPFDLMGPGSIEPPPPYTFWKPPSMPAQCIEQQQQQQQFPSLTETNDLSPVQPLPNEAPPSYEESIQVSNSNIAMSNAALIIGCQQSSLSQQFSNTQSSNHHNEIINVLDHQPSYSGYVMTQSQPQNWLTTTTTTPHNSIIRSINLPQQSIIENQPMDQIQQTFTKQISHSNNSSGNRANTHAHHNNRYYQPNNLIHHNSIIATDIKPLPVCYRGQSLNVDPQIRHCVPNPPATMRNNLFYPQRLISHLASSLASHNDLSQSQPSGRSTSTDQYITRLHVEPPISNQTSVNYGRTMIMPVNNNSQQTHETSTLRTHFPNARSTMLQQPQSSIMSRCIYNNNSIHQQQQQTQNHSQITNNQLSTNHHCSTTMINNNINESSKEKIIQNDSINSPSSSSESLSQCTIVRKPIDVNQTGATIEQSSSRQSIISNQQSHSSHHHHNLNRHRKKSKSNQDSSNQTMTSNYSSPSSSSSSSSLSSSLANSYSDDGSSPSTRISASSSSSSLSSSRTNNTMMTTTTTTSTTTNHNNNTVIQVKVDTISHL